MEFLGEIKNPKDLVNKEYVDEAIASSTILKSKTFENVIATNTTQADSNFYFGAVKVDDYIRPWSISLRIKAYVSGKSDYAGGFNLNFMGIGDTVTYYNKVAHRNVNFRTLYYAPVYRAKVAGATTYGHALGVGLRNSSNPTHTDYKRTIEVYVLEENGCAFEFFDEMLKYAAIPGTGSTNYNAITEPSIATNGFQESSDTDTYDRLKYNVSIYAATAITSGNIITHNGTTGYQHLKTGAAFDIRWPILYAASTIAAGATGINNYLALYPSLSATQAGTWQTYKPIYIKGNLVGTIFTPVSTAPLTQTEPTTEDGYDYMFLGIACYTASVYLEPNHPIYRFKNGAFKQAGADGESSKEVYIGTTAPENEELLWINPNGESSSSQSGGTNQPIYSQVIDVTTSRDITVSDFGKMLKVTKADIVLTIPDSLYSDTDTPFNQYGYWEFTVLQWKNDTTTTIQVQSPTGSYLVHEGDGMGINRKIIMSKGIGHTLKFKRVTASSVIVIGDCEVTTK